MYTWHVLFGCFSPTKHLNVFRCVYAHVFALLRLSCTIKQTTGASIFAWAEAGFGMPLSAIGFHLWKFVSVFHLLTNRDRAVDFWGSLRRQTLPIDTVIFGICFLQVLCGMAAWSGGNQDDVCYSQPHSDSKMDSRLLDIAVFCDNVVYGFVCYRKLLRIRTIVTAYYKGWKYEACMPYWTR